MNPKMKDMPNLLNLPSEIIIDIFLLLPILTIISCKCVCKKWLNIISSPDFPKLHLSKSTPGLLVSIMNETQSMMFELENELEIQRHDLPYRPVMKFDMRALPTSTDGRSIGIIMCAVNGLLCVRDWRGEYDTLYVCNPVTREYVTLPKLFIRGVSGIGISALSGLCKVVRVFGEAKPDPTMPYFKTACMIYTLGTQSWRSIKPYEAFGYHGVGTFLKGNLHWLVGDTDRYLQISCLDLETELFQPFPPPFEGPFPQIAELTVLGDCLCVCNYRMMEKVIDIWIMKDYGLEESWTKEFVINLDPRDYFGKCCPDRFLALKVYKDGDILIMMMDHARLFYECKETQTKRKVNLFEGDTGNWFDALLHTPSFVSLRSLGLENVTSF